MGTAYKASRIPNVYDKVIAKAYRIKTKKTVDFPKRDGPLSDIWKPKIRNSSWYFDRTRVYFESGTSLGLRTTDTSSLSEEFINDLYNRGTLYVREINHKYSGLTSHYLYLIDGDDWGGFG